MIEKKEVKHVYFPVWMKMMSQIEAGDFITSITKKIGISYNKSVITLNELVELGWARKETSGRRKIIVLTEKGKIISDLCNKLINHNSKKYWEVV